MIRIAIGLAALLLAGNTSAQPVRMILPVSAGSGVDTIAQQGNVIQPTAPQAAAETFRRELAKYARVVKAAGVKID